MNMDNLVGRLLKKGHEIALHLNDYRYAGPRAQRDISALLLDLADLLERAIDFGGEDEIQDKGKDTQEK
jgi:hypothetical protein